MFRKKAIKFTLEILIPCLSFQVSFHSVTVEDRSSKMFRDIQPFRHFLKSLSLYGFNFRSDSKSRKFLSILMFLPTLLCWMLVFLSLLQFNNVDELTQRLLFLPSVLAIALKAFNIFANYEQFEKVIENINSFYAQEELNEHLRSAASKALLLAKVQSSSMTVAAIVVSIVPHITRKLLVPMFKITIRGYEAQVFWFYKFVLDYGSFYGAYLMLVVDLMTVCLLIVIAESFIYLNKSFKALNDIKTCNKRARFIQLIETHKKQKQ